MSDELHKLPLHARHEALGARFSPFAGFEMPMRYGSIVEEHQTVRQHAGIFDVSHMGEVELRGSQAGAVADYIVTNSIGRLEDGQAVYTVMCHPDGGIVDDLIVYRLAEDRYLACINASNREKDYRHMLEVADGRCEVINRSDEFAQLAVQGPDAEALLNPLANVDLAELASFCITKADVGGHPTLVARTGYTGEDGFELYIPVASAEPVFDAIWDAGQPFELKAIGLAARDTLRLEARYPLYGSDITDDTTPLEAGLGWVVKLKKGDFRGRDALIAQRKQGLTRRLRGFVFDGRGVLRAHCPIYAGDTVVGETTSGGPSPTLGVSVALGYVAVEHADAEMLDIDVRGRRLPCTVTTKPFYKRAGG